MPTDGVYHHPPGTLSRWGVLDVGLKCVHSCKHCFYSFLPLDGQPTTDQFAGMRHAGWHRTENLLALVDSLAEHGFLGFDITGGEPTAHPGLVDIVKRATGKGIASRVITLGQFLTRVRPGKGSTLLEELLDSGICDFRFSLHAVDREMFKRMTGGDRALLTSAMDKLEIRGFQHITNTTITEENYRALPDIAWWISRRGAIYATTWLFFMPYYQWAAADHQGEHRVRYTEISKYLREAVEIVESAGIAATIRYAPHCMIGDMQRNHVGVTSVRYDIHEWMNQINHTADPAKTTADSMAAMGYAIPLQPGQTEFGLKVEKSSLGIVASRPGKVFPNACKGCAAIPVCDGVDTAYLQRFGSEEMRPFREFRGDLIDRDRLRYKAGHIIKIAPTADARSAVREALGVMTEEEREMESWGTNDGCRD